MGSLIVHWDGKMLPDLIGNIKVDRIAILVSYNGTCKFLGAPIITSSTGENIANVVHEQLVKWNIADHVKGMSFDTTSTNTGVNNGAAYLLQKKIGRDLLLLPCRHHIYEIFLRNVFESKLSSSSAPEVPIFERFARSWADLNRDSFKSGIEDENVRSQFTQTELDDIKNFCHQKLSKPQIRDDYKEFLQLALIFIGAEKYNFCTPGATSNARWMSKALYSFKIFVFRDQFTLTKRELNGFRALFLFFQFKFIGLKQPFFNVN